VTSSSQLGWGESPFGELVTHGAFGPRFSGSAYADDGNIATLRTTDIDNDGRISYDTMPLAHLDEDQFSNHILKLGDLVITRSGTCGIAAVFEGFRRPVLPGAFLLRFRLNDNAHPHFFRYYFNSPEGRSKILSVARGAVQQNLNITNVIALRVPLPSVAEQRRIAATLSAYDNLIENNRRRMALLEESARLLYREWFVRLRFPGYEHTGIIDGVPEGWRNVPLGDITTKIGSGFTPRGGESSYVSVGVPLIRSMNVYDDLFQEEGLAFVNEDHAVALAGVSVESRDILLNITGASVARCCMAPERYVPARVNQHVMIIRIDPEKADPFFVHKAINSDERKRQLLSYAQKGSTREALTKDTVARFEIKMPTGTLMRQFGEVAAPLFQQREVLALQNKKLRLARDLMLPRLMRGELTV